MLRRATKLTVAQRFQSCIVGHPATAGEAPSPHPKARASKRAVFVGGQDHRHGLRVDRLDDHVQHRRQKVINAGVEADKPNLNWQSERAIVKNATVLRREGLARRNAN
jgi:hypothetical protein